MYQLKTEKFTGPLDALLALIEEKKMDISEISLAQVTDDFLRFVKELKEEVAREDGAQGAGISLSVRDHLRILADFIAVASKLLLMKSKLLLPGLEVSEEEQEEMAGLERRLRVYKALKPAMKKISLLWSEGAREHSRGYLMNLSSSLTGEGAPAFFYPDEKTTPVVLSASLKKLFDVLEKFSYETETIKEKIRTLEEEMSDIADRLQAAGASSLGQIASGRSRGDVVLAFLAILHLARDQKVFLRQEESFSDILIETNFSGTNDASGASPVAEES